MINATPANLGLDLRGGVHFLMEVDSEDVILDTVARYEKIISNYENIGDSKMLLNGESFTIFNVNLLISRHFSKSNLHKHKQSIRVKLQFIHSKVLTFFPAQKSSIST